jgi:hypothetical protein
MVHLTISIVSTIKYNTKGASVVLMCFAAVAHNTSAQGEGLSSGGCAANLIGVGYVGF